MTAPFAIRPATRTDGPAVRALVSDVLREFGFELESHTTDADLEDVEASYFARGGSFDVVVDATGTIVGCAGLYVPDAPAAAVGTGELRKMYLRPAVRGKGLGRRLLDQVLDRARTRGMHTMVLETASNLDDAIALYRRYGFVEYQRHGECASRCDRTFRLELST